MFYYILTRIFIKILLKIKSLAGCSGKVAPLGCCPMWLKSTEQYHTSCRCGFSCLFVSFSNLNTSCFCFHFKETATNLLIENVPTVRKYTLLEEKRCAAPTRGTCNNTSFSSAGAKQHNYQQEWDSGDQGNKFHISDLSNASITWLGMQKENIT